MISTYKVDIVLQVGIGRLGPFRLHSLKSINELLGRFVGLFQFFQCLVQTLCDIQQTNDITYEQM